MKSVSQSVFFTFIYLTATSCTLMNHFYFYDVLKRNPVIVSEGYSQGKILIVPMGGNGDIGIYNKDGYFEKVYSTNMTTFYGEMIDNNRAVIMHFSKEKKKTLFNKLPKQSFNLLKNNFRIPGSIGVIAVYNFKKKGKREMIFKDSSLHHDISIKSSSRVFALSWHMKEVTDKEKKFIVVYDSVVEIDLQLGKIIKRWPLKKYLPIHKDKLAEDRLNDVYHSNAVDYIQENPINGREAILITLRNYEGGKVILIDLTTNELLWQSKKNLFAYPHDAKFTKDKTMTIFSNGRRESMASEILEMDIKTNKIVWAFKGREGDFRTSVRKYKINKIEPWKAFEMFSPFMSGVQKTDKGYLVTVGSQGKIYEVSKKGKIVWMLPAAASFFYRGKTNKTMSETLFKVRQYK